MTIRIQFSFVTFKMNFYKSKRTTSFLSPTHFGFSKVKQDTFEIKLDAYGIKLQPLEEAARYTFYSKATTEGTQEICSCCFSGRGYPILLCSVPGRISKCNGLSLHLVAAAIVEIFGGEFFTHFSLHGISMHSQQITKTLGI